ncbi:hypothetical protein [Massilia sp. LC238]|uniref:hypothetical protein n=1 Tax=Massilia sp. LC238 TaxID=1502852 RepID=UPI0004E2D974|nr:hypothetical protein [Massilia sp. LC238]KFC61938.1 hypothetical protein FG94_04978 [Massilia sp. LC238]
MTKQATEPSQHDQQHICRQAVIWRKADKEAIAHRGDVTKQRAEYRARQDLRRAVDIAEER